ncbi:MAG: hypothetical protein KGM49_03010 [Sphingomonadales bacterium]|nr:hypothetical protein [Sphingomonadales bacterium]
MRRALLPLLALATIAAAPAPDPEDARAPIPAGFYRLAAEVKLPGKAPDWDYLAHDAARGHLFVARRGAGLWVFDTRRQRLLKHIANTEGAGATLLIPALGRGYSTNEDGSTTVFDLSTLTPLRRVKFAEDADAASYDPVTGRIAFVSADSQRVTLVEARSLKVVGHVALTAKKADASVGDGAGHILLNERDRAMLARIDAATGTITAEWPTTGCTQPTGLAYDPVRHRAFVGCRGAKPVLAVVNTDTGAVVQTLDLGRGNDGVVFDPIRRRIITTNGVDANIVIFRQDDADHYRLEQVIATRPNARTIAYDPARQRIFTVTAEGVVNPAEPVNTGPSPFYPNAYYDNSFTVLTYAPVGKRPVK